MYGSVALIIIFCAALAIYFYVQRRKRIRNNPRDDYEFDMVPEDEARFPLSGAAAGGRRQARRRGGELYDAFAGESDEEDILSDDERSGSDNEKDEPYHDTPDRPAPP
jgi:kexin